MSRYIIQLANKINIRSLGAFFAPIVLSIVILAWVTKLWAADLRVPFCYTGDGMSTGMFVKGLIDNGWYLHNSFLGMPAGQYMYDYPFSANLDFIIMKLISIFAPDYAITMNLYFLLTFPLTTITAMLVFRKLKLSYASSILGSLLFAFIPYHIMRGEPHLFLAAYYMIPPMILVILWVFTDNSLLFCDSVGGKNSINKKFVISALICILISSAYIYYPFFSCFFLLIAGITAYISQRNKYQLLNSFILILIIILGVLANVSPTLIYQHENGKNPEVAIRGPAESEIYGLKIAQLLMPISGHRIPLLAKLSSSYSGTAPLVNENAAASLGIIGSMGFLLLIAWAFYRISNGLKLKEENILRHINELSILNLSAVLLATLGGFGTLFAYLFFSEIRCYNRISIFIAFFSIFAVVLVLDALSQKYAKSHTSRLLFNAFICLVLVFGILDQTSSSFVPPYASTKAEYLNDEHFVNSIEAIMPENAMIFQLPYMPFPEHAPIYKMENYFHLRMYLHSKDLRWSYGAMKGRIEDDWQNLVSSMLVEDMVKTLSQTGFEGIYIDSYGFEDSGAKLISDIKRILEIEPLISDNGRLYFFDMTGFNNTIKSSSLETISSITRYNSGWHDIEDWSGVPTRWMQADGTILVVSLENRTATLNLNTASFYRNRTLEVYAGDVLAARVYVPTSFINVSAPINLAKGANTVRMHVPEGCERPMDIMGLKPDNRCITIAVQNLSVT